MFSFKSVGWPGVLFKIFQECFEEQIQSMEATLHNIKELLLKSWCQIYGIQRSCEVHTLMLQSCFGNTRASTRYYAGAFNVVANQCIPLDQHNTKR